MGEDERIIRRAWRRTTLVVSIAAVAGAVAGWATSRDEDAWTVALAIFTCVAVLVGMAGMLSLLPTSARASSIITQATEDLTRDRRKIITSAIRSGVPLADDAGPELRHRALTLARATAAFNGLILVQNLLLFAGAAAPQFARVVTGDGNAIISRIFLALFVIEMVFVVPLLVVRGRRARRYADAATAENERRSTTEIPLA
ncbi:hypothetical protein N8D74_13285 [Curtobacterium flaccumfaciens]|uniref:Uncharacterized protein n=1 Tax=Curtobacterium poinsettiae TaxID=159612 RepID=A0A9Q9P4L2_9MICO|nr:hypothetical protein [Curtobacterium flaccumfaciens]UXN24527.1 hypothetical protein N8D74_13285 [Curtobacterium flaccumfaciens]UYC79363.1 hypothetical protein OE229_09360 [Curtobacterium flaccumfaciens pv. poinsettiae]